MAETDTQNIHFQLAVSFVNYTRKNVFLTGKAGTGKTTFLRYIRSVSFKNIIVAAPTGVAAINAGGVTLHSLFQLPFGSYVPTMEHIGEYTEQELVHNKLSLLQKVRYNSQKRKLLQELELLVIDEVSMVRADLLDAVDQVLRSVRKRPHEPFGGVQMLFIGDLFQLPPVVQDNEWNILSKYYRTPFFFDAMSVRDDLPLCIELDKIYRQDEPQFIALLNRIRNNEVTGDDLDFLNAYYKQGFQPPKEENYIILTTHNYKANAINEKELKALPGEQHVFTAETEGEFSENSYPVDKQLYLKEGAQVMFIKNDKGEEKKYYNGKIGVVHTIVGSKVYIRFPGEQEPLLLEKEVWRNIRYTYDEKLGAIEEDELGKFSQYPVRLAWAVTIHKSQGLTFEKAVVDAGDSFAPGQVYVALSRLISLKGLILHSRISAASIRTDTRVSDFIGRKPMAADLENALGFSRQEYIAYTLMRNFNWNELVEKFEDHHEDYPRLKFTGKDDALRWSQGILEKIKIQETTASKFMVQLQKLIPLAQEDQYKLLYERVKAAAVYFSGLLENEIVTLLKSHREEIRKMAKVKKYLKTLDELFTLTEKKIKQVRNAELLAKGLYEGSDNEALLDLVQEQKKQLVHTENEQTEKSTRAAKGETYLVTLEMFRQKKTVEEIAIERQMSPGTIETHLAKLVGMGEVELTDIMDENKIRTITEAVREAGNASTSSVKKILDDSYTWGEVRIVMAFINREKEQNTP